MSAAPPGAPRLSVVIPTFRRPAMLAELLDALVPQLARAPEVEALVVDNSPEAGAAAGVAAAAARLAALAPGAGDRLIHLHAPEPGVVRARNAGVAAARGTHVLFLDDDEVPAPAWLDSFRARLAATPAMVFGRIRPRYAAPPPPGLERLLHATYSREADAPADADIGHRMAYLGTGNAMFHKAGCLSAPVPGQAGGPFDLCFNRSGGEDIWLIRACAARGVPLLWNPDGLVEELVPADRLTMASLCERKFHQGRQRCLFLAREGGARAWAELLFWMAAGAAQLAGYGALALAARAAGRPQAQEYAVRIRSGLGKLLWWTAGGAGRYS